MAHQLARPAARVRDDGNAGGHRLEHGVGATLVRSQHDRRREWFREDFEPRLRAPERDRQAGRLFGERGKVVAMPRLGLADDVEPRFAQARGNAGECLEDRLQALAGRDAPAHQEPRRRREDRRGVAKAYSVGNHHHAGARRVPAVVELRHQRVEAPVVVGRPERERLAQARGRFELLVGVRAGRGVDQPQPRRGEAAHEQLHARVGIPEAERACAGRGGSGERALGHLERVGRRRRTEALDAGAFELSRERRVRGIAADGDGESMPARDMRRQVHERALRAPGVEIRGDEKRIEGRAPPWPVGGADGPHARMARGRIGRERRAHGQRSERAGEFVRGSRPPAR